jgi:hypothetical protein
MQILKTASVNQGNRRTIKVLTHFSNIKLFKYLI